MMKENHDMALARVGDKGFLCLNLTQFLGALNDNIYKWLLVYLLISIKGTASANIILALSGAIFVLPFIIFSSLCGKLADNYSKTTILRAAKVLEIAIMLAGVATFTYHSEWGSYGVLFLMAAQSALFGPSKYGILPEIFAKDQVPAANGWLSLFTNVAIIMGSFLAAWITDQTAHNFFEAGLICVAIAVIGTLTSFGIPLSPSSNQGKRLQFAFWKEIYSNFRYSLELPYLATVIIGNALFFMIAAYCQMNIIAYAINDMGLSETTGGYLFPSMAIGIGVGSLLAGSMSTKPRLDFLWKAGLGVSACLFALFFAHQSLVLTFCLLFLLGVSGGFYIVPTDSFIQIHTPEEHRGEMIGMSNVLSFFGVMLGSLLISVIGDLLNLNPRHGFLVVSALTVIFAIFMKRALVGYYARDRVSSGKLI